MFKWRKTDTFTYWHLLFLKSTETSNSKVVDKINAILSPSIKLNVAYETKKRKCFSPIKTKSQRMSLQMLYTNISAVNVRASHILERQKDTFRREQKNILKVNPLLVKLVDTNTYHTSKTSHSSSEKNTSQIREALVYNTVPSQYRMNNIRPPYQLQLFDAEVKSTEGFSLWFLTYLLCFCYAFDFNILFMCYNNLFYSSCITSPFHSCIIPI